MDRELEITRNTWGISGIQFPYASICPTERASLTSPCICRFIGLDKFSRGYSNLLQWWGDYCGECGHRNC
jgi:hypothetical protein